MSSDLRELSLGVRATSCKVYSEIVIACYSCLCCRIPGYSTCDVSRDLKLSPFLDPTHAFQVLKVLSVSDCNDDDGNGEILADEDFGGG